MIAVAITFFLGEVAVMITFKKVVDPTLILYNPQCESVIIKAKNGGLKSQKIANVLFASKSKSKSIHFIIFPFLAVMIICVKS